MTLTHSSALQYHSIFLLLIIVIITYLIKNVENYDSLYNILVFIRISLYINLFYIDHIYNNYILYVILLLIISISLIVIYLHL
jgi:hypothetical protein